MCSPEERAHLMSLDYWAIRHIACYMDTTVSAIESKKKYGSLPPYPIKFGKEFRWPREEFLQFLEASRQLESCSKGHVLDGKNGRWVKRNGLTVQVCRKCETPTLGL